MKFPLKDIKANPFRMLSKYPVIPAKVEKLKKSINQTGFWENIVCRVREDGKPELSHGHNRLAALKELFPADHEVNLIVRKFSDAQMIQSMAAENDSDYEHSLMVFVESVKTLIQALGEGKITEKEMPPVSLDFDQPVRYAPSFVPKHTIKEHAEEGTPYTVQSVAAFFGITQPSGQASEKVHAVIRALELIERGIITEQSIEGLNIKELSKLTSDKKKEQVLRVERLAKAQLDAKAFQERQSKLDAQRHEQEAKDAATERKRLQELAEARLEKDKEQIKELEEQRKKHREQAEARALVFKENRAKLNEKIEAAQERAEAFKPKPEETLRAQTVGAMVFKFNTIYSDASGVVKESEILGRNQKLTPTERELLRQSMLKAGERLRFGANNFLPPGATKADTKELAKKFFKKLETK